MKQKDGLRYVGAGAFLVGVPARDLEPDEVEAYGGEKALLASKLYEKIETEVKKHARD